MTPMTRSLCALMHVLDLFVCNEMPTSKLLKHPGVCDDSNPPQLLQVCDANLHSQLIRLRIADFHLEPPYRGLISAIFLKDTLDAAQNDAEQPGLH